jgi:hypothetical protein
MQETTRFALEGVSAEGNAHLLVDGRPGERIAGAVLEMQYALTIDGAAFFVLFVTHGSPYEELLHVYLIDPAGRVVERLELGGAYAPGVLRDVRVLGEHELAFDFQGPRRLVVRERPAGLFRKRRLEISGSK